MSGSRRSGLRRRGHRNPDSLSTPQHLADHFFRHEYGRLVALLARRVGTHHIEAVEDAVQSALTSALDSWPVAGVPDNPTAWLFRVARNALWDELRRGTRHQRALEDAVYAAPLDTVSPVLAREIPDDMLRMLFACCDDAIPVESQLVLALKILCGFEVREIAVRLFTSDANVYKRLQRARSRLRDHPGLLDDLSEAQCRARLPAVQKILYLMFTEGYLSSHAEFAIRRELCAEAMRLTSLVAKHPMGDTPETSALMALMHLHYARLAARQDDTGGLLLLEEQDREQWDDREIACGLSWLARSAAGEHFSRYHAEAGIAAEHCLAPTFQETNWAAVVEYYELLEQSEPSMLHRLNRAVAVAELHGPAAGLALLEGLEPPTWLAGSYMWMAVLADLHRRCGNPSSANRYGALASELASTPAIRRALERRLHASS